ncbi:hypothetical protein AAE478_008043 [Parahypoxylon ruwenzoriense]
MAAVVAPFQFPMVANQYRDNLMIDYAFTNYKYIITPRDAQEIANQSHWDDVDAFVKYMMQANFGDTILGTNNVKLPATMRIYTDEEVDAMDAGLLVTNEPTPVRRPRPYNEEELDMIGMGLDANGELQEPQPVNACSEDLGHEDEPLPLYSPDIRPAYIPSDFMPLPPYTPLATRLEPIPEEPEEEDVEDSTPDTKDEPTGTSSAPMLVAFRARLDNKLRKARRKLARGLGSVSPMIQTMLRLY